MPAWDETENQESLFKWYLYAPMIRTIASTGFGGAEEVVGFDAGY